MAENGKVCGPRAWTAEQIEKVANSGKWIRVGFQTPGSDGSRRLIKGDNNRQPMIRGSSSSKRF